ncbi:MAG: hypothetical protein KGJ09_06410 [Candidatus Omnitrophica bacterium]|nr:hypothetical protein [Candidatus Omnitrophota bacterium]MDE2009695.1 hypothetical protein [Candidatus Omnitrophota bacterium]MDE2213908.1 hypothetical protein [Candidatus Omnitrophota bacterium]MDE2231833.1 hypothetical protein [Candidatus Omnitrophota bacterium]
MNKMAAFLVIVIATMSFCLGLTMQSRAQQKSFAGVIPFSTTSDRIGFFDQTTGRVYIYDNNINNCLFIGQIRGLGQTIQPAAGK